MAIFNKGTWFFLKLSNVVTECFDNLIFQQGVTIPSQRRYVYYYEHLLKGGFEYKTTVLMLHSIQLETIPNYNGTCSKFIYQVNIRKGFFNCRLENFISHIFHEMFFEVWMKFDM